LLTREKAHRQARSPHRGGAARLRTVAQVDTDNAAFVSEHLIDRWLGADLVGWDGAHACALIVLEAASPRQRQLWLPLMQQAVMDGWAAETDLVFLEDRAAVHAGQPQIHGTATHGDPARLWPLADPEQVNALRKIFQLSSLPDEEITNAWTFAELGLADAGAAGE
jgi:hypothetical protein